MYITIKLAHKIRNKNELYLYVNIKLAVFICIYEMTLQNMESK